MRFHADESVDAPIVDRLRRERHDVTFVAEMDPGLPDEAVLAIGHEEGRILLTADKDFGFLVYRQRKAHSRVVLIRLPGTPPGDKASIVEQAISAHGPELAQSFTVVSRDTVRIRRL